MNSFHPSFTREILEHSQTATRLGINNTIPQGLEDNAVRLSRWLGTAEQAMQMQYPGARLMVSSGYRSPTLNANKSVGGAVNSYHTLALAADIIVVRQNIAPLRLAVALRSLVADSNNELEPFDQLIHEFGRWVHVQLAKAGQKPRQQCLTAKKDSVGGVLKTVYVTGLVEVT